MNFTYFFNLVALPHHLKKRRLKAGFTLLEILPVLLITAVLGATVVTLGSKQIESQRDNATKTRMETVEMALQKYRRLNNRLPCPAPMTAAESDSSYGQETSTPGTCTGAVSASAEVVVGTIPAKSLGLSPAVMSDSWGNLMMYYVDKRITEENATLLYPPQNQLVGDIRVLGSSNEIRTDQAVYALLSFGENAHGALKPGNEYLNTATTNALEQENNHFDAGGSQSSLDRELVQAILTTDFDDQVTYKNNNQLDDSTASGDENTDCPKQLVPWDVSGASCEGELVDGLTDGESADVQDIFGIETGSAIVSCSQGELSIVSKECRLESTGCLAPGPYDWGSGNCTAVYNEPMPSGTTVLLKSTTNYKGSVTLACDDGAITASNISCDAPCDLGSLPGSWSGDVTGCVKPSVSGTLLSGEFITIQDQVSGPPYGSITYQCVNGSLTALGGSATCHSSDTFCPASQIGWRDSGNGCYGYANADNDQHTQIIHDTKAPETGEVSALCSIGDFNLSNPICRLRCEAQSVLWSENGRCSATTDVMQDGETMTLTMLDGSTVDVTCNNGVIETAAATCLANGCGSGNGAQADAPAFSLGQTHTCGIGEDDAIHCWGRGVFGMMGDGSTADNTTPNSVVMPAGVTEFVSLSASYHHNCAIADNGKAYCWGNDAFGELGNGAAGSSSQPVEVTMPGGVQFTQITTASYRSCAIGDDNNAYCWGQNSAGQLGDGTTTNRDIPVMVVVPGSETGFKLISANNYADHVCALALSDKLYCWGVNDKGQFGNGTTNPSTTATPTTMPAGVKFTHISVGAEQTCALGDDNKAYCWGEGLYGRLGTGGGSELTPAEVPVPPGSINYTYIDTFEAHTCGLTDTGEVYCWGSGTDGQLGDGTNSSRSAPTNPANFPSGVTEYLRLDVGRNHTCAQGDDDNLYCWGNNAFSRLGDGTTTHSNTPVKVLTNTGYTPKLAGSGSGGSTTAVVPTKVSAGGNFTCQLDDDGNAWCWGNNGYGQLGNGITGGQEFEAVPVTMPSGVTFTSITAGGSHACALDSTGDAWCWGRGNVGQLGNSTTTDSDIPSAVSMPSGRQFIKLSAGGSHTCAIAQTGQAYCWGYNNSGQLGIGSLTNASTPQVISGEYFQTISAGLYHTCGVNNTNQGFCWGFNNRGQLGNNVVVSRETTPTAVVLPAMGNGYKDIQAGYLYSCGTILALGPNSHYTDAIFCWGEGGHLGDNNTAMSRTPVEAVSCSPGPFSFCTTATPFSAFSVGRYHSCALYKDTDDVVCWGLNDYGQIGDNTTTNAIDLTVVTLPSGVTSFTSITTGDDHTCAIADTGKLYCWGYNANGRLGDGTDVDRHTAELVVQPETTSGGGGGGSCTPAANYYWYTSGFNDCPVTSGTWSSWSNSGSCSATATWSAWTTTSPCNASASWGSYGSWGSCSATCSCTTTTGSWTKHHTSGDTRDYYGGSCPSCPSGYTKPCNQDYSCYGGTVCQHRNWRSCGTTYGGLPSCCFDVYWRPETETCTSSTGSRTRYRSCNTGYGTYSQSRTCSTTPGQQDQVRTCEIAYGTQTRTVACVDDNGDVVDDSYCNPATKPSPTQQCSNQTCSGSSTRTIACSASCSGPSTRTENCSDSSCSGSNSQTQSCTKSC